MGCVPEKPKDSAGREESTEKKKQHRKSTNKSPTKKEGSKRVFSQAHNQKDDERLGTTQNGMSKVGNHQEKKTSKHSKLKKSNKKITQEESPTKQPIFAPAKPKDTQNKKSKSGGTGKFTCKILDSWGKPCNHPECQQANPFVPPRKDEPQMPLSNVYNQEKDQ